MMPHEFEAVQSTLTDGDLAELKDALERLIDHMETCEFGVNPEVGFAYYVNGEAGIAGFRHEGMCGFTIALSLHVGAYLAGIHDQMDMGLIGLGVDP